MTRTLTSLSCSPNFPRAQYLDIRTFFLVHYIKSLRKNKKGIIKILVYSSVIDINQMEVIFATIIAGGYGRFA